MEKQMHITVVLLVALAMVTALTGCDGWNSVEKTRVTEVKCKFLTGLNKEYACLYPDKVGADLEIIFNTHTQAVQIIVTKNDDKYFVKDFILKNCIVVNGSNWKCVSDFGDLATQTHEMHKGRYNYIFKGKYTSYDYTSSINGLPYWLYKFGMDFKDAFII
jgi:hypothetical protein